jgi:hypothetical protein
MALRVIDFFDFLGLGHVNRASLIPYRKIKGQAILLVAEGSGNIARGRLSDLGGSCEMYPVRESATECLIREFREETGGMVLNIDRIPDHSPVLVWESPKGTVCAVFWEVSSFDEFILQFVANDEASAVVSIRYVALLNNPRKAIGRLKGLFDQLNLDRDLRSGYWL